MPMLLGIAFVFNLLPQVLSILATVLLTPALSVRSTAAPGALMLWPFVSALLVLIVGAMGKGALVEAGLATSEGRPCSFASAVSVGIKAFPSNLGIIFLDYLGVGFASILLVVPGMMLLCRWIAAVPANVAERPGVLGSLGRSRDLTAGHRWRIFGLLLIFGLLSAVVPVVAMLIGFRQNQMAVLSAGSVVVALSSVVFALVGGVGIAAIYVELRAARGEGLSPNLIAAFE